MMQSTKRGGATTKGNTIQEIFVCFSILLYSILWLPLCIGKYPDGKVPIGLDLLIFSFLSSITGCSLFLISIVLDDKGYQKAAPIFLAAAILICFFSQFIFSNEYCTSFFLLDYDTCYVAESLSFFIYMFCCYYFMCISLSRTRFTFAIADLQRIKTWFGSSVRGYILLVINISMLIIIFIHIHTYSYFNQELAVLNVFDVIWVALVTVLAIISITMRFNKCVAMIAHKWLLMILVIIALIAFCIGFVTVWKYRLSNLDGVARVANVFIWCVVNIWALLEFMTIDINTIVFDPSRLKNFTAESLNQSQTIQQQ